MSLMKKDLKLILSNKMFYILGLLIVPIFLLINGEENVVKIFSNSVAFLGYALPAILFEYEIKLKSKTLIQSLSINRLDIVISKYIFIFISYTLGVMYILLYLWIINKLKITHPYNLNLLLISKSILGSIISMSIILPMYFGSYYKSATIINSIILYFRIFSNTISTDSIYMAIGQQGLSIVYVIGIIIYLISMRTGIVIYENREFY